MAKVRTNLFNGGGNNDAVFCAPKATSFPTTLAAPGVGFVEVGWLGDDGFEFDSNVDRKEFKAHQGGVTVKRKVTGSGRTFKFTALESNITVMGLAEPGVAWVKSGTGGSTIVTGTVPEGIATVELAWIIDTYDESSTPVTQWRRMFTGEATLSGAYKIGVEDITAYEFEVAVYGSPIIITNQAGLLAAVS